jgi:hypothetical protein
MKTFLALLLLAFGFAATAQTKKEIADRQLKSITTVTFDSRKGDTTHRKNISRYDKHGNVIESIDYDNAGAIKEWEQFQFNKHDDEILYQKLSADGKVVKKTTTEYNKWNNATEKISTDADGALTDKTTFAYNVSNDLTEETQLDPSGRITRKTVYEYDNKGMLLSRKIYNEKGELIYSREFTNEY